MTTNRPDLKDNPLLVTTGIPDFEKIKAHHVAPALNSVLAKAEEVLQKIEKDIVPSWNGLLKPLEEIGIPFEYAWGPITHLLGVKNSDAFREAHQAVLNKIVSFFLRFNQSLSIYQGLKNIKEGNEWQTLNTAQKRVIEIKLKEAKHSGVELKGEDKNRFNEIKQELSQLATDFSNHLLDATKAFSLTVRHIEDTAGWPENLKQLAAQSYNQIKTETEEIATAENGPWRITLDFPSFGTFIQHHRQREDRQKIYHAFMTRASEAELDNRPLIDRILKLRLEMAKILGFDNYADLSLDSKMAPDTASIEKMSEELKQAAQPFAKKDLEDLKKLAIDSGQTDPLKHWDMAFWGERLREQRFDYTDEQLRPYFQLPKVLDGLFSLAERLFSIVIEPGGSSIPKWHPDVQYFKVLDSKQTPIASFYLDPYSRPEEKSGGAWMDECLNRRWIKGSLRLPIIYLCCNGTPPIGDRPSLMSFREVETLFHEFGHGLQGMLTRVDYSDVAGINGVEWDAVELPSQFMENWCYHKKTLLGMTEHFETGEQLPTDLFNKILESRTFQSGLMMMRQLLFGITDIKLHNAHDPNKHMDAFKIYRQMTAEYSALPPYEHDYFLCGFSHIFAGGYAAGYYSYKWAEVLSADAFAAFEEGGLENDSSNYQLGQRFKETILSKGGSEHPMEIFKQFRGREPSTAALLRHSGLLNK